MFDRVIDPIEHFREFENAEEAYHSQQDDKIEKLRKLGKKYSKATEYYDNLIECRFVKMPAVAEKLVNQIGNEILEILKGK